MTRKGGRDSLKITRIAQSAAKSLNINNTVLDYKVPKC
ncbi:hypothetical protein [Vibrio phage JSF12]|uniref:Uncharacterized protein n=2 Tax=Jesfedecavirus TaxID=2560156 RepID=A0A2D0Z6A3_9CAUD|nr:hypothetical protein FDI98_gp087 [Vibrio phage JSF10]YP_009794819.1 hypothetical protein HOS35_gp136 [Vibrio phage JSF12]ASV43445.1 hypothetical protein [Vibrio phage JSF10]ASV43654.1 hypothetical protein [Vibrio phage JSF12]